jgi:nucleoside-diphosphate-sugar epimerase
MGKKVLIIGGSGFIGPHIVRALHQSGHEVTVLNRGNRPLPGTRQLVADRHDAASMTEAARAVPNIDVVIDTSAYGKAESALAFESFGSRVEHWMHLSSAAVYAPTRDHLPGEDDPIGGAPIWGDYGRDKSQIDEFLLSLEEGPRVTIFRPPYVYGPGNNNQREAFVWARCLRQEPVLVPGDGSTPIQLVHAADLAAAFVACLGREGPLRRAYNIANSRSVSLEGWTRLVAASADLPVAVRLVGAHAPDFVPRQYFPFRDYPCQLNVRRLQSETEWRPVLTLEEGHSLTFGSYSKDELRQASQQSAAEAAILSVLDERQ